MVEAEAKRKCPLGFGTEQGFLGSWRSKLGGGTRSEASSGCGGSCGASSESPPSACPMSASSKAKLPSACPMSGKSTASVMSDPERLNPRNMMPEISQTPLEGQTATLSRGREVSTIPKTAADDNEKNWVYPSPQQFYKALARKDKQPEARYMDAIVHVHNRTNEVTWQKILAWESVHEKTCPTPSLLRFVGRSEDLSNKAQFKSRLTYLGRPFDRHDWYVDRCGLKTVRYVIDYYDDEKATDEMQISIDARPAMDNLGNAWDRLRKPAIDALSWFGRSPVPAAE